jgi:lysophospholipase L1-like esterase
MNKIFKTAALVVAAAIAMPIYASRGTANFSQLVILGDSYGAGYESGSLNERHQPYSWGAVLAKQVGLSICAPTAAITDPCFAIPLVSYPGIPAESVLTAAGPVPGSGSGAPRMSGFGRPYNNLSVPGYTVAAAMALTGTESNAGLGSLILRGLGSEVDQAIALHPTFIALWLGGNDFLGAVSQGNPALLTPPTTFATQYKTLLDRLVAGAPNAGFAVGTLPETFSAAPLTGTLPTVVFDANFRPVTIGGSTFPLIYLPTAGTIPVPVPTGSVVLLAALPKIQTGFGIPPALAAFPPFNALPNAGKPLTDADIITPTEIQQFTTTIAAYNATILAEAAAHNVAVADIRGLFTRFAAATPTSPMILGPGPMTVNNTFVRGGLFSLDGVHLTDLGYVLFANEYVKAINASYGTHIPLANVSQFLENNDPHLNDPKGFSFGPAIATQMISIFNSATVAPAPPPRRRSVQ